MSSTNLNPRINFGKTKHLADAPDLLDIQLESFREFFQLETTPDKRNNEGLFKVFKENFPITDTRNIFVLEFLDYFIDPPRYSIVECMERGLTYAVPLKAKLRLSCNDEEHVDFQTIVQDVFLGNIPYMTEKGSFVINGAEPSPKSHFLDTNTLEISLNDTTSGGQVLNESLIVKFETGIVILI